MDVMEGCTQCASTSTIGVITMWANIVKAGAQVFNAVGTTALAAGTAAEALNHSANALKNLAIVAEETSAQYVDNARGDRELAQVERLAKYEEAKAKALAAARARALPAVTEVPTLG